MRYGVKLEEKRQKLLKSNLLTNKDKDPTLLKKAEKCDEEKMSDIDAGHFERMYHTIYRQLSPTTHLNAQGIQMFIDKKDMETHLFYDGKNGDFLIIDAIGICVCLVKDLYKLNVIKGDLIDTIKDIERHTKECVSVSEK